MTPSDKQQVAHTIDLLQQACHKNSLIHGFHELSMELKGIPAPPETKRQLENALIAQKLMLIVTEVAEACEGIRENTMDKHLPQYSSLAVELVDGMIRILDTAEWLDLDLGPVLVAKMEYNESRPHKHGKEF